MYIDYNYYMQYGGKAEMDCCAFNQLEYRARKIVDRYTQGRVKTMAEVPEAAQRLMVELVTIEKTQGANLIDTPAVSSFSNDGYSESYAEPLTASRVKEIEANLILEYLSGETDDNGTPLLWLGMEAGA